MYAPARFVGRVFAVCVGGLIVVACTAGAAVTPSPTARPTATPTATPNPHLPDKVRASLVYAKLREAGIEILATNAQAGRDPAVRMNGTYDGWPFALIQYKSRDSRERRSGVEDGEPGRGEPPYTWAGMNIVFEWGPSDPRHPPADPAADRQETAERITAALDRLLGPLVERSHVRLSPKGTPYPTPVATPTPDATPTASPKPS